MIKYFVVSDIHGFYDELKEALHKKGFEENNKDHKLIICGDAFDRGTKNIEVYYFIKDLAEKDRLVYIRGNHEDLLFDCVEEYKVQRSVRSHHISNGTFTTMREFEIMGILDEVLNFISTQAIDYCILNDYLFCHGYVPIYKDKDNKAYFDPNASKSTWDCVRWENGMDMWHKYGKLDYTVVCGHWHCSWGWSHLKQKYKEFPQKSHEDFNKSFEPFIEDGIIAIDACTAWSKKVNCIVFEVEEDE